jgi:hypothetical protein
MGKQITVNRMGQYKKAYTSVMISNCTNIMLHGRYRLNVKQKFCALHNNMSWHIQMLEIHKNPMLLKGQFHVQANYNVGQSNQISNMILQVLHKNASQFKMMSL